MSERWDYDPQYSLPSSYQHGSPGRAEAERRQDALHDSIAHQGQRSHSTSSEDGSGCVLFLLLAPVVAVALVVQFLGGYFHQLHGWVEIGAPGTWIYWVCAGAITVGFFRAARGRKGSGILTVLLATLVLGGSCGDRRFHPHVFPVPAGASFFYIQGEMNIRTGPGTRYEVIRQVGPRTRVLLGPSNASGWAPVFTEDTHRLYGYLYRRSELVRPEPVEPRSPTRGARESAPSRPQSP